MISKIQCREVSCVKFWFFHGRLLPSPRLPLVVSSPLRRFDPSLPLIAILCTLIAYYFVLIKPLLLINKLLHLCQTKRYLPYPWPLRCTEDTACPILITAPSTRVKIIAHFCSSPASLPRRVGYSCGFLRLNFHVVQIDYERVYVVIRGFSKQEDERHSGRALKCPEGARKPENAYPLIVRNYIKSALGTILLWLDDCVVDLE